MRSPHTEETTPQLDPRRGPPDQPLAGLTRRVGVAIRGGMARIETAFRRLRLG